MSAPVDHLPPWEWSEPFGRETMLSDANGEPVLTDGNDSTIVVASPYVRELVRAAPEMEALLRVFLNMTGDTCVHRQFKAQMRERADALLKRLDEARKAGG